MLTPPSVIPIATIIVEGEVVRDAYVGLREVNGVDGMIWRQGECGVLFSDEASKVDIIDQVRFPPSIQAD